MNLRTVLEKIFAAAAFAEKGDRDTALQVAGLRTEEQKREKAQGQKRTDTRARLRA